MYKPIDKSFFMVPGLELAQNLLGQYIVHEHAEGLLVARIVETEAYQGPEDRAAHSFGGRRTKRTEIMYGEAGYLYAYQMHTHTLINVVGGPIGTPHANLLLLNEGEPRRSFKRSRLDEWTWETNKSTWYYERLLRASLDR